MDTEPARGGASAAKLWDATAGARRVAAAEAATVRKHLTSPRAKFTTGLMAAGATARALRSGARGDSARAREQIAWARGYLTQRSAEAAPGRPPATSS